MLFLGVRSKASKWTIWVVAEVRGDTCSHLKFSVAGQVTGLPGRQSSIIRVGGDMGCQVDSPVSYEWAVTCVAVK